MPKKFVIIVAGGSGKRMNSSIPKQFLKVRGIPILMRTLLVFYKYDKKIKIILALPEDQIPYWKKLCRTFNFTIPHDVVKGGLQRFQSVKNALAEIKEEGIIAVHDGVRPLVSEETIDRCFKTAIKSGTAIPVIPVNDSLRMTNGQDSEMVDRSKYKIVQTPQVFKSEILLQSYHKKRYSPLFTDDASVVEMAGEKINLVDGNIENIKITTPLDIRIAESYFHADEK
ncbi:MAG: 2-C-methyl-D-erythritol 4-phosphate cytidylyltransferase [Bacteroidota bacterium]|nr:2-C-methyl-D-erythritol 4-phosphate cytidylyltransferase [Bacteroidota bacterium]MDP4225777.1 2-C-methyl-D-erythritol 4-phosphate cytidylyltransferase [Bacteroidota bacterium]MDP4274675.1 2-C-methyl-D-erythritol 4-phosphate cytidylyltransferase [Bacteroidota bacterium]